MVESTEAREGEKEEKDEQRKNWYDRYYKLFLALSLGLLLLVVVYLFIFYAQTGDFMYKGVSLTGGTTLTVYADVSIEQIKEIAPKDVIVRQLSDLQTGEQIGFSVETAASVDEIKPQIEALLGYNLTEENSSVEFTGSALSESFYRDLIRALIIAFILMALVVFIIFRTYVPSLAVILAAVTDIGVTLAIVNLMGFRLSTAGIAAFLMLLGYSVDTDIMLTNRALRTHETPLNNRLKSAFITGVTMTLTSFFAVFTALLVSVQISSMLTEIFMILSIGLAVDLASTWLGNASILKLYCEKKDIN